MQQATLLSVPSMTSILQSTAIHATAGRPTMDFRITASAPGVGAREVLIGVFSGLGALFFCIIIAIVVYFLRNTTQGRILLDRVGRPGSFDDEAARQQEEEEALETMTDLQRQEYSRAQAFIQSNPPETTQTDISLSQFLAIQEKGVSAWEFEPELEIANCFVESRTEIEFFDSECSVQSNLPIPKQNEVYYFEGKIYEKPESTLISIGVTTKPYPLFRLPGLHKTSIAYLSNGQKRHNQPFNGVIYGPEYVQGDVIGVGYRPRTGSIFFTRNGKKLEDVAHGLKTQNFFPTIGANGPCRVHVNFGQSGFVFIEGIVKKWGFAPMTGSLAPPPPYGSEAGSVLLETGGDLARQHMAASSTARHGRTRSRFGMAISNVPTSPGPIRSPTEISLSQLAHVPSNPQFDNAGEGSSRATAESRTAQGLGVQSVRDGDLQAPPPDYESPKFEEDEYEGSEGEEQSGEEEEGDRRPLLQEPAHPPIPSYAMAVSESLRERASSQSNGTQSPSRQ